MYIPDGYGTMFPYLFVNDAGPYIEFLKSAFAAEVLGVTKMPSGEFANARVKIGTTCFMLSEARGEQLTPSVSAFYLYVEDANAAFKRALESGARQMFEPMDMPYGDRQGGVTDPAGNIWFVSTRLQHEPYDVSSEG
jgi:PhnB protein